MHQDDGRIGGQCPRLANSLLLTARQLARPAIAIMIWRQTDEFQKFIRTGADPCHWLDRQHLQSA